MSGAAERTGEAWLGIGAASRATAEDVRHLAETVLAAGGIGWDAVAGVATSAALAGDARLAGLGPPVVGFDPGALRSVPGVEHSARVEAATGSGSVAEAAALLAAGAGARLAVAKRRAPLVTAALAVR